MSFQLARGLIVHLVAFALILQAVELLRMLKIKETLAIWSEENLRRDLSLLPLGGRLAGDRVPRVLAALELILAIGLFLMPMFPTVLLLLLVHVLICVRFRGSVNGGSDAMTVVVLTGLLIAYCGAWSLSKFGLIYIAIHLLLSYLRAGLSKLRQPAWREGRAVGEFLKQSFFADTRLLGDWIVARPAVGRALSIGVIGFEMMVAVSLVMPRWSGFILASIVLFHFSIFMAFGLNRFFWIWLSAWPSIFYAASLLTAV